MPSLHTRLQHMPLMTLIVMSLCTQNTQAEAPAMNYATQAGDTLEKIVQKQYPSSPLQVAVLTRHVQEHNAAVLGKTGPRQKLKTGTTLQLPAHELLVQRSLTPYLPADAQITPAAHGPEARKRWVHYP